MLRRNKPFYWQVLPTPLSKTAASCFEFPTLKMEVTESFAVFERCLAKQNEFVTESTVTFPLPSWYQIWLIFHILNQISNWKFPLPPLPRPFVILCCRWIVHTNIDIKVESTKGSALTKCYSLFHLLHKILIFYMRLTKDCFNTHVYKHSVLRFLTLRRLTSYIYGAPILDVSRSHTTTQHSR